MQDIQDHLKREHADCDETLVATESAVAAGDWDRATELWQRFDQTLRLHLQVEEEVLFPALEHQAGMVGGPTEVMRMDHDQMRGLLGPLEQALTARDADAFLGYCQSMLVLIQQHNMKEEQVLYPMADQMLSDPAGLVAEMRARARVDAG